MNADAKADVASAARLSLIDERRRRVAESLHVGNPANHARDLPPSFDAARDAQLELEVESIHPYEHNPRRSTNARFAEIKESIRASGVKSPVAVTRRPGDSHFIVEAGGNTRLLAVQQLWAETGDARFRTLTVQFRPWRSETHVLSAHLIENEQRGDMTFRDRASGIASLKARLEAERGTALSLRQLEQEIAALGLSVSTATLSQCLFAVARLGLLFEQVPELSGMDVKALQPRLNLMKRYAQLHQAIPENALYADVFAPVFREAVTRCCRRGAFHAGTLCEVCELALARHLDEPVDVLRFALERLSRAPLSTLADLRVGTRWGAERPLSATASEPAAADIAPDIRRLRDQLQQFARGAGWEASPDFDVVALVRSASPDRSDRSAVPSRARCVLEAMTSDAPAGSDHGDASADRVLIDWLVDPHDPSASAFWETLTLIRELRRRESGAPMEDR